ncbi:helix-turn-helix domain-containing protein [Candidatus Enterococcus ikei]|uniref:Helix-turn-helix domain-containing protein n=1 Tax=Candidatus Enterococcus ikei TaxID=2815326 RepID=A0ABS3GZA4_9ENTE|nr:helix-turn-helix domain-containing protein [Enterococcus sp. DIV0869a]MBO0440587.1 helix-turn-helix domain-containing protein [Enterococcus sp. DIV0869a]
MLEAMMLEDTAKRKLTLFKSLIRFSDKQHSINFFENRLDYSYSRVVYLLEQIQQDLTKMTGTKIEILQTNGVHYKQYSTYDMYYQYLITQSVPYQLLVSILFYPDDTLNKFCEKNYHSRTTVVRKSSLLSNYFKQFGIKMNTSQLKLYGDERMIRITLYTLIWLASQGTNLPKLSHALVNYEEVTDLINPYFPDSNSYSAHKQITLMLDIVYLRITSGNILTERTKIDPYIPTNETYAQSFFGHLIKDTNAVAAEAQFASYLLSSTPNFFREDDHRLSLLHNYLDTHINSATKLMNEFCDFFSNQFVPDDFSWAAQPILFGNIGNIIFSSVIMEKPFPTLFRSIDHSLYSKNEYYYLLFTHFKTFFRKISKRKNFDWLKDSINQLSDTLAALLVPLYSSFQVDNVVRIAMIAESNYLLVQPLTQFINELPFVELVAYNAGEFSSFDFLLTTSAYLIPEKCHLPSFVFRFSSDNDEQYIGLYQAIKALYNKKSSNHFK